MAARPDRSKKVARRQARTAAAGGGPLVVGIGASAGGLDAFRALIGGLPASAGMAFVLLQHLSDESETHLPAILARETALPVELARDGEAVAADRVYVCPAGAALEMREGRLLVLPRADGGARHPIDRFFTSLAASARDRAVAVVLSGTGSDGALGVCEVSGAGGIVIVQDPSTAAFDAMPRAAIATRRVDHVLAPAAIAEELGRIARHPAAGSRGDDAPRGLARDDQRLERVYDLLTTETHADFHLYRRPTILRRVARRMVVNRVADLDAYVRLLESDPAEIHRLHDDLLIHVTRFFRDPETFRALRETVFPRIFEARRDGEAIRVWVPGCSTGEEPYSLAMSLIDALAERGLERTIQIFGTDISDRTIEIARAGVYTENSVEDVPPDLLRRYFTRAEGGYRIARDVRDVCVFAQQDLLQDPPFSHLDLVVCRNVLIYLEPVAQRRIIGTFHYALRPEGYLMLGAAETTGSAAELFAIVDKRHRIYARRAVSAPFMPGRAAWAPGRGSRETRPPATPAERVEPLGPVEKVLLERFAPAGVLVDDDLKIVQTRGRTGAWLELPSGAVTLHLLGMLREGLVHGVRAALHAARNTSAPARREGLRTEVDGVPRSVDVEVIPIDFGAKGRQLLVLFEDRTAEAPAPQADAAAPEAADARVARLQRELEATRSYMEAVIHDLESTNEELQSANEEILTSNEELQSTNEELDTMKEELQSTNEELNTVNEEIHARNEELSRANSDLLNLLGSVQIAIVMVDADLRIRRFTPAAEKVLNLIATDIGRPIGHFAANLDCPELERWITQVIDDVTPSEREVRDAKGRWHVLRLRPYKNADSRIDGAIVSLFDVDLLKRHELEAQRALAFADAIVDTIREPLMVLDGSLTVRRVNTAFCRQFLTTTAEVEGRYVYELGNGQWDIPDLRSLLEDVLPRNRAFEDFRVEHEFPRVGRRVILLNARRIETGPSREASILLAMEDVAPDRRP